MTGWHPRSRVFEIEVPGDALARSAVGPRFASAGSGPTELLHAHVVDVGPREGPVLVLLHGIAQSSWAWRWNVEPLARAGFRVVAICQKGHGWSSRGPGRYDLRALSEFVLSTLDRLGIHEATWVGSSLGGGVALWTALHKAERVSRLILLNPACHVEQFPWPALRTQIEALAPVYRALVGPTLLRIPLAAIAYRNLPIDRDYMAGFWAPFVAKGSMRALVKTASALSAGIVELDRHLPEIAQPTLIVWGEKDGLLPVAGGRHLVQRLPNARLVLIPEAGHCPHEETPERVNKLLIDFASASVTSRS